MPPAVENHETPTRSVLGQFLKFLGLMLTIGGALAGLRTMGLPQHDWFYAIFIPLGLIVWAVGFYLCGSAAKGDRHG